MEIGIFGHFDQNDQSHIYKFSLESNPMTDCHSKRVGEGLVVCSSFIVV